MNPSTKKSNTASNIGKRTRSLLYFIHHALLTIHLIMILGHSFKTGFFGIEFWLTLIVNVLLLVDLDALIDRLLACIYKKRDKKIC